MKHFLYIILFVTFLLTVNSPAQTVKPVDFQTFDSYFEVNNSGLKGSKSYLVLTSEKNFDKIFQPAATMGENHFLPDDAFRTRIVIATVKRGNLRKYDEVKVTENNGTLFVSYQVQDSAPGGAVYKSPLILAVDQGKYKEVVFLENGKKAGTVKIKK
jgi:hypothetical protein